MKLASLSMVCVLLAGVLCLVAGPAEAVTIGFDNLTSSGPSYDEDGYRVACACFGCIPRGTGAQEVCVTGDDAVDDLSTLWVDALVLLARYEGGTAPSLGEIPMGLADFDSQRSRGALRAETNVDAIAFDVKALDVKIVILLDCRPDRISAFKVLEKRTVPILGEDEFELTLCRYGLGGRTASPQGGENKQSRTKAIPHGTTSFQK